MINRDDFILLVRKYYEDFDWDSDLLPYFSQMETSEILKDLLSDYHLDLDADQWNRLQYTLSEFPLRKVYQYIAEHATETVEEQSEELKFDEYPVLDFMDDESLPVDVRFNNGLNEIVQNRIQKNITFEGNISSDDLAKLIEEALHDADKAVADANEGAKNKPGIFGGNAKAIEDLQNVSKNLSKALFTNAIALQRQFLYIQSLTKLTSFALVMSAASLDSTESLIKSIQEKTHQAANTQLNNIEKKELHNLLERLQKQREVLLRLNKVEESYVSKNALAQFNIEQKTEISNLENKQKILENKYYETITKLRKKTNFVCSLAVGSLLLSIFLLFFLLIKLS